MKESTREIEKFRVTDGTMPSDESYGFNGVFAIPIDNRSYFQIICSDGGGWEHVSITVWFKGATSGLPQTRIPRYDELCKIKGMFWQEEEAVVHFFPRKSQHVNNHNHVLHLWKITGQDFPEPPPWMVGILDPIKS